MNEEVELTKDQKELQAACSKLYGGLKVAERRVIERTIGSRVDDMGESDLAAGLVFIYLKRSNPSLNWIAFENDITESEVVEKLKELGK